MASLLSACAGSGGGGSTSTPGCTPPKSGPTVLFSRNIQPIFDRSCAVAGCHDSATRAQLLDLSQGQSYKQIVRMRSNEVLRLFRVKPHFPDMSYLIQKIEKAPGITGAQMPQGCPGAPLQGAMCLSANDMAAIRQWIVECALNN